MKMIHKLFLVLLFSIALIVISCSDMLNPELGGEKKEIQPPATKILNIPAENEPAPISQLYQAVLQIGWKGISDNSLIRGFYYQITSEFMERGEVVIQEPVFTNKESATIVFPSRDKVNKQVITVFAQDKDGRVDPVGDSLTIYTRQSIAPDTRILFPNDQDTLLVNAQTDYIWKGFKVVVADSQPNPYNYANPPEIMDYLYKIDDGEWSSPQSDSAFYIDPEIISGPIEGPHKLYVKARNTAYKDDTTAAELNLYLYLPDENKREWLIIDDTNTRFKPKDSDHDQYFEDIFNYLGKQDVGTWDVKDQGVITMKEIKKYKYVLYHSEDAGNTNIDQMVPVFTQYLETGGRLMITTKETLDKLNRNNVRKELLYYGDFISDFLHIKDYRMGGSVPDKLQGLNFVNSPDTAIVDSNKISASIGGVTGVTYINEIGDFAEPVFEYATGDSANLNWNGADVGIGYYNDSYRLIFCGFPMYPFTVESGAAIISEVETYFNEEKPF
ncbi:MAG: hypothetical protein ACLFQM_00245 [Fidelibacterota bacterium]